MSYISRKGAGLMGFGSDAGSCRTGDAVWQNGNWWIPIRDAAGKEYSLMQSPEVLALPKCTAASAAASSSGPSIWSSLVQGATEVLKAKVTPAPVTNVTSTGSPGLSMTTKAAIVGGLVLGGVLIFRARK